MRIVHLMSVAAVAVTMAASPAMAACKNYTTVTPDNAPVNRTKVVGSGGSLNGSAYTKATFCPVAAAAGTCTGESLSERVGSTIIPYVTYDGNVADIEYHRSLAYNGYLGFWYPVGPQYSGHSGYCW